MLAPNRRIIPARRLALLTTKLPHNPRAILRRISPQHRTEHLNGFFALPVIRPGADVADVWAELVDDLLDVLKLLWGKVGVVEQPIKFGPVKIYAQNCLQAPAE